MKTVDGFPFTMKTMFVKTIDGPWAMLYLVAHPTDHKYVISLFFSVEKCRVSLLIHLQLGWTNLLSGMKYTIHTYIYIYVRIHNRECYFSPCLASHHPTLGVCIYIDRYTIIPASNVSMYRWPIEFDALEPPRGESWRNISSMGISWTYDHMRSIPT
jgi:hypothetical protein